MVLFKKLFRISLKNLFRNKRRTILTLMILALGSTGLVLIGGFFESLLERLRQGYIVAETGHLQISHNGYFKKGTTAPLEFLIQDTKRVQEIISENPMTKHTYSQVKFGGMLSTDETSIPVLAVGVEPEWAERLSKLKYPGSNFSTVEMSEGEYLDSQDPYGILVGKELKEALGVNIGDTLSFLTTRRHGAIDGAEFHVKGVFRSSIRDLGGRVIKMPIKTAQELLLIPNQVHRINVLIGGTENTYIAKEKFEKTFKDLGLDLEVIPWNQQGEFYQESDTFLRNIYRTVQVILSVVFFLSIANIINMTLFERMREYGTMMAIGNSRGTVVSLIFFEATILGFFGAIFGLLVGTGVCMIIASFGILLPPPPNINIAIELMFLLTPTLLLETFLICFFATVLSTLIPAYRASRSRIIVALGYV